MPSTYLTKTFSGGSDSDRNFTISFWFKCSSHDRADDENIYLNYYDGSNRFGIGIDGNDKLKIENYAGASYTMRFITDRSFRDTNAWYHLVCRAETNASAQEDRFKIYINGVQETSFSTATYIPQNNPINMPNSSYPTTIGAWNGGAQSWNGSMSHFHICDGYSYDATAFGETDATTGEWKIKTSPSVTYGNNGFFILKDGNSVTDQSGNSNNFTVGGGTLTKTEDCPSNVFATMNALQYSPNTTFSNGNNVVTQSVGGNGARRFTSTLGASSGKYYWETKITGTVNGMTFGIVDGVEGDYNNYVGYKSKEVGYEKDGVIYKNAVAVTTGLTVVALNDVVNHALDLDNGYIYFGVNGTWQNSGVPTSGATGTGGFSITADTLYHPAVSAFANTGQISCNFGNGYFGTTAVASAGTNASGNGIFEYDVPTGFTALSTKGLNL